MPAPVHTAGCGSRGGKHAGPAVHAVDAASAADCVGACALKGGVSPSAADWMIALSAFSFCAVENAARAHVISAGRSK